MKVTLSFEVETKDDEMAGYIDDHHHEFELVPTHADALIHEATDAWRAKGLVGNMTAAGADHNQEEEPMLTCALCKMAGRKVVITCMLCTPEPKDYS